MHQVWFQTKCQEPTKTNEHELIRYFYELSNLVPV